MSAPITPKKSSVKLTLYIILFGMVPSALKKIKKWVSSPDDNIESIVSTETKEEGNSNTIEEQNNDVPIMGGVEDLNADNSNFTEQ